MLIPVHVRTEEQEKVGGRLDCGTSFDGRLNCAGGRNPIFARPSRPIALAQNQDRNDLPPDGWFRDGVIIHDVTVVRGGNKNVGRRGSWHDSQLRKHRGEI